MADMGDIKMKNDYVRGKRFVKTIKKYAWDTLVRGLAFPYRTLSVSLTRLGNLSDVTEAILVSGAPRSGTTWLYEILLALPRYRDVFEPLNPSWSPRWKKICYSKFELCRILGPSFRPYLHIYEEREDIEVWKYMSDVFRGKVFTVNAPPAIAALISRNYSAKTRMHEFIKMLLNTSGSSLVKVVRGNRLLPWIVKRFELRGIYMIIRHPCATILSQLRTGYRCTQTFIKRVEEDIEVRNS